ncbi:MAG: hypothetical protein ACLU9S_01895 [Oscillospiraceae bacterium]
MNHATTKAKDVSHRTGNHGEQHSVAECLDEDVVIQEHPDIVGHPDEPGCLNHVEIGKADDHRDAEWGAVKKTRTG